MLICWYDGVINVKGHYGPAVSAAVTSCCYLLLFRVTAPVRLVTRATGRTVNL